mmetsp:Transcript_13394/g.45870  ORF Transcript_13394/g.45870 Transcript_13394/m.45870 type:complete len:256 (+) Transcript_13394:1656-2423(+)
MRDFLGDSPTTLKSNDAQVHRHPRPRAFCSRPRLFDVQDAGNVLGVRLQRRMRVAGDENGRDHGRVRVRGRGLLRRRRRLAKLRPDRHHGGRRGRRRRGRVLGGRRVPVLLHRGRGERREPGRDVPRAPRLLDAHGRDHVPRRLRRSRARVRVRGRAPRRRRGRRRGGRRPRRVRGGPRRPRRPRPRRGGGVRRRRRGAPPRRRRARRGRGRRARVSGRAELRAANEREPSPRAPGLAREDLPTLRFPPRHQEAN